MKKNKKKKSENSSGMPDFHCDFSLTSIIREEKHCGKEREKERKREKESCASDLIWFDLSVWLRRERETEWDNKNTRMRVWEGEVVFFLFFFLGARK